VSVRRAPAPPRASYHHGDLRRALVDATIEMLAEVGPDVLSLREVARRVGVDHRAAYRHFTDKEALFAAVAEEGYRNLVATVRRDLSRLAPSDVLERLRALARAYTRFAAEHPGHYRVMSGPRLNESGRFPEIEIPVGEAFGLLQAELQAGVALGALDGTDVEASALALWAQVHGIASLVQTRRMRVAKNKLSEVTDRLIDKMLHGLARRHA
jgi:AcrR family transcriptional regulator